MILFLGGACIGYIVIIGDITTPFLNLLGNWEYNAYAWRIALMALVSVFILWPLCLLKRIDSLRYTSFAAIACIFYLVGIIMIKANIQLKEIGVMEERIEYFEFSSEIFAVLPIIAFAYTFHMQIFPIMVEMKHREHITQAINSSIMICLTAYLMVGIFGYLTFYDDVKDNILNNYVDADVFISIGKLALFFIICFSYPLLANTAR